MHTTPFYAPLREGETDAAILSHPHDSLMSLKYLCNMESTTLNEPLDAIEAHQVLVSLFVFLLGGAGWFIKRKFFSKPDTLTRKIIQEKTTDSTMNVTQDSDIQSTQTQQSPHHQGEGDVNTTYPENVVHHHGMTPEERQEYRRALEENGMLKVLNEQ